MKTLSKEAVRKIIDFHLICIRLQEDRWLAQQHCEMVCWLRNQEEVTYERYCIECGANGISWAKNFDEEALRESLQAGATQFMNNAVTDPLAGE